MKTKYMSRKFIIAICGLVIAIVALVMNNNLICIAGLSLGALFIIGESAIDKIGAVKKSVLITERHDVNGESKD